MVKENISQEFRLKNIDEIRYHFIKEIKQNELMSKKNKRVCTNLNYFDHSLVLWLLQLRDVFQFLFFLL